MKIKLLMDLPVEAKHNLVKDSIHEVVKDGSGEKLSGMWIVGHNGENVKVLSHEYEVIK